MTLVVDTTVDEGDGGETLADPAQAGPRLSLREAVRIAANRTGPTSIMFDEAVFPAEHPATIAMGPGALKGSLAVNLLDTCIDARNRGVIVDWRDAIPGVSEVHWQVGTRSLMIGLVLIAARWPITVDGQAAGCRIGTADGTELGPYGERDQFTLRGDGALVGPGNAFATNGATKVLAMTATPDLAVAGNYFGFDPVSRRTFPGHEVEFNRALTSGNLLVENNVFASSLIVNLNDVSLGTFVFRGNRIGVDDLGNEVESPGNGVQFISSGAGVATIGPDNVVTRTTNGLQLGTYTATITRNSIYANGEGIVYATASVLVPTIATASSTEITGTCASDGSVELFSDAADQGEVFLGDASCTVAQGFSFRGAIPVGRNVTGTLTTAAGTSAFSAPLLVR